MVRLPWSRADGELPVEPGLRIGERNVSCERDLAREQPAGTSHEVAFARSEPRTRAARSSCLAKMPVTDDLGQADGVAQLCQRLAATLQPRLAAAGRRVAKDLLNCREPGLVDQRT